MHSANFNIEFSLPLAGNRLQNVKVKTRTEFNNNNNWIDRNYFQKYWLNDFVAQFSMVSFAFMIFAQILSGSPFTIFKETFSLSTKLLNELRYVVQLDLMFCVQYSVQRIIRRK